MQQIPMEKLVGKGVIINVKQKASIDPDYRVTVEDLVNYERTHGSIPDGPLPHPIRKPFTFRDGMRMPLLG